MFSDLDPKIQLPTPTTGASKNARLTASVDEKRALLTVYRDGWPIKVYPTQGTETVEIGEISVKLRPGDAAELAPIARRLTPATVKTADTDGDGIVDPLDVLIGAKKTVLNGASYGAGYIKLDFPMGDVPRDVGVCTDVIIRAVRNAGIDIQAEVNRDIRRARRAYPMVRKANAHIDHRRVKTLVPYFSRHWDQRATELDSARDPLRPGDVVFMDTFPSRSGPDHIGIVSDRRGPSGHPLIINNWTDGHVTSEMDLLGFVPETHRFRIK